jgi:hypothetical protein
MANKKEMSDEQVFTTIDNGDFPDEIKKSNKRVAIIMTQDWCPQWHTMRGWVFDVEADDLDVYVLVYNKETWFDKFREFKESVLKNDLIPYVQYYVDGELQGKSNFVNKIIFLENLGLS